MNWRAGVARWVGAAGLMGGAAVLGCAGASTAPTAPGCQGAVQVVATPGTTPTFTWAPACGMSDVIVETVVPAGAVPTWIWHVAVPERTPVPPGVRYGVVPRGAREVTRAQPLVRGTTYRVRAQMIVGGDVLTASGSALFTP